jgi:hypothetical protein
MLRFLSFKTVRFHPTMVAKIRTTSSACKPRALDKRGGMFVRRFAVAAVYGFVCSPLGRISRRLAHRSGDGFS